MCANFQPISPTQAPLFTNQQLSFDVKQDIYPGYAAPLLFANPDNPAEWRSAMFGMVPKWAKDTIVKTELYQATFNTILKRIKIA